MAGSTDSYIYSGCPCSSTNPKTPLSFVESNYYCESGSPDNAVVGKFYTNDPLWDGHQYDVISLKHCTISSSLNVAICWASTGKVKVNITFLYI